MSMELIYLLSLDSKLKDAFLKKGYVASINFKSHRNLSDSSHILLKTVNLGHLVSRCCAFFVCHKLIFFVLFQDRTC